MSNSPTPSSRLSKIGFRDAPDSTIIKNMPIVRAIQMSDEEAVRLCIDRVRVVKKLIELGCKIDGFTDEDNVSTYTPNILILASREFIEDPFVKKDEPVNNKPIIEFLISNERCKQLFESFTNDRDKIASIIKSYNEVILPYSYDYSSSDDKKMKIIEKNIDKSDNERDPSFYYLFNLLKTCGYTFTCSEF